MITTVDRASIDLVQLWRLSRRAIITPMQVVIVPKARIVDFVQNCTLCIQIPEIARDLDDRHFCVTNEVSANRLCRGVND